MQGQAIDAQAVALETKREADKLRDEAEKAELEMASQASVKEQQRKEAATQEHAAASAPLPPTRMVTELSSILPHNKVMAMLPLHHRQTDTANTHLSNNNSNTHILHNNSSSSNMRILSKQLNTVVQWHLRLLVGLLQELWVVPAATTKGGLIFHLRTQYGWRNRPAAQIHLNNH